MFFSKPCLSFVPTGSRMTNNDLVLDSLRAAGPDPIASADPLLVSTRPFPPLLTSPAFWVSLGNNMTRSLSLL